jgi:hypothetical protein
MKKIKMYGNFDIREELERFRNEVIKKHPNLSKEVEELEKSSSWDKLSKALALKEILLKTRIDPDELNSKYLISKLNKILLEQSPTSQTSPNGDFSKEKEHNISLKDNSLELSQMSNDTSLNNNIKSNLNGVQLRWLR